MRWFERMPECAAGKEDERMDAMKVTVNECTFTVPEGTTLFELSESVRGQYAYPIVLAEADGKLRELANPVSDESHVRFFTTGDPIGMQILRRSCSMLFFRAVYGLLGEKLRRAILHFSVGKGYYYTLDTDLPVDEELIASIENEMHRLTDLAIPFRKRNVRTSEACEIFRKAGMLDKEKLFRTRLASRTNIYDLDGYTDYNYGFMVPDTGYIKDYRLLPYKEGIILMMPELSDPFKVPELVTSTKLFTTRLQGEKWAEKVGIDCVGDLNDLVINGDVRQMILISEALQEAGIAQIAKRISGRASTKFVMIAGPSSSGKTTFSQRLCTQLSAIGLVPHYIGVDNYFIPRAECPLDEFGNKDFESLRAIDLQLFNRDMTSLLNGEKIELPTYDFITGLRVYNGEKLRLSEGEILVIEGIHCLNEELSSSLPSESKFRIYISALTQINVDEHNRISSADGRLLRRIIRDYRTRGYSAESTLAMWDSVRRGEESYIFPYQEAADEFFNSALPYETAVMKQYVMPLLFRVPEGSPQYHEARRLLKFLDYFMGIPLDDVPQNSILREFLGGGCFRL